MNVNSKKIITIAGKLGSGKSSAAKKVASILNLKHFSSGDFLREIAQDRKLSIQELMTAAESDPQIDYDIDQTLREKGNEYDIIIDSRLAFHWIPGSFKVYLDINEDTAAKRMLKDLETNNTRLASESASTLKEMKKNMIKRHLSDIKRYKSLYDLDHTDHKNFDLIIDTGLKENNLDTVVQRIITGYKDHIKKVF